MEQAIEHQRLTFPDDGEALDRLLGYLKQTNPTTKEIKTAICELYGFEPLELEAGNRHVQFALARQIFCFLAYKHTRLSMRRIAERIGLTDHSTVLHAIRKIEKQAITTPLVRDDLDLLRLRISEKILMRRAVRC
jgi:chromosomal replication initiator protein